MTPRDTIGSLEIRIAAPKSTKITEKVLSIVSSNVFIVAQSEYKSRKRFGRINSHARKSFLPCGSLTANSAQAIEERRAGALSE